jgi:hypothetical protein
LFDAVARGNGPVAPALKVSVPDLTLLSKTHGGKFPLLRVEQAIDGEEGIPAVHGTREMPVYYELFKAFGAIRLLWRNALVC